MDDQAPSRTDIEQQLQTVLNSATFANQKRPADILELVVNVALANPTVAIKQDDLLEVFPSKDYEDAKKTARVNAGRMRKLVKDYYAGEGRHESVLIEFPAEVLEGVKKTANYTPSFRYNPSYPARQIYISALHHLTTAHPYALGIASVEFAKIVKDQPQHTDAMIGLLDTLCCLCLFDSNPPPLQELIERATEVVDLHPDWWRAHVALGTVQLLAHDEKVAQYEFEAALLCNEAETKHCAWYQAYLMATYQTERALEYALDKVDKQGQPGGNNLTILATWLYLAGRIDEASEAILDARANGASDLLSRLVAALLAIELHDWVDALDILEVIHKGHADDVYGKPGIYLLPSLVILCATRVTEQNQHRPYGREFRFYNAVLDMAQDKDSLLRQQGTISLPRLQAAICDMATGRKQEALVHIYSAILNEPLMYWLLRSPLLDPLLKLA